MWGILILALVFLTFSLLYQLYNTTPISFIDDTTNQYDYIIVGAGTAGCVLASRLSEAQHVSVLLIEAGEYFQMLSSVPLAAPLLQRIKSDWAYITEPQKYSSKGLRNHTQFWPRGKGLGGSGQMNYMLHSFGIPEDYDHWPSGWSYADLKPYFERVEDIMNITMVSSEYELSRAFFESQSKIVEKNASFSAANNTIRNGSRWSTYHAYLMNSWNRKNLNIKINSIVTRIMVQILFENRVARAVEVERENGALIRIKASKEIILCGGAVNTPQLLLLSGIGPTEELKRHGIPVVLDQEHVGKNLHDHLNVPIYVNLRAPVSITLHKLKSVAEMFKYLVFGTGLLASNAILATGRANDSGVMLFGMGSADETVLKEISNYETGTFRKTFPSYADERREGFIYMTSCLQPKSRGQITLRSSQYSDPPIIDPRYLQDSYDVICSQRAIDLALQTLKTKPFMDLGASAHVPELDECNYLRNSFENSEFIQCLIRTIGFTTYHPGGTCKMGYTKNDAVVDKNLRVFGIGSLRIMDASVMPSPISGTPNSVIIAMAERAADIIKKTSS